MRLVERLGTQDWESLLHAPFHAYVHVAGAEGAAIEAQFRRLTDELDSAREAFAEGSLGQMMVVTLADNLDAMWAGYKEAGRSPKDGLVRARKVLRKADAAESAAIRDWLINVAVRVSESSRTLGTDAVSPSESQAIHDIAQWLDRPIPEAS